MKYAETTADIRVRYKGRLLKPETYELIFLPPIYRVVWSDTKDAGLIIALDVVKDAKKSEIKMFFDSDDVLAYIREQQGNDDKYYVWCNRGFPAEELRENRGIESFNLPEKLQEVDHLRKAVQKRKDDIVLGLKAVTKK